VLARAGVQVWNLSDAGPIGESTVLAHDPSGWFGRVVLNYDGSRIAAASGQTIHLWDRIADGDYRHRVMYGHQQDVVELAFSADGLQLASAGAKGDVRLWTAAAEQPQATMMVLRPSSVSQNDVSTRLLFGLDGEWLAASSIKGTDFWRLNTAALLDQARQIAARELTDDELQEHGLKVPDVLRGRLLREADRIAKLLENGPEDIVSRRRRADLLACAGSFPEAIEEMRRVISVEPQNHWPQYNLLPLLAQVGDASAFRQASEDMAAQFADETQYIEILERVAKGTLFWADSGVDWREAAQIADKAVKQATATRHQFLPWFQGTKALAEYRLGNFAAALEWADKVISGPQAEEYSRLPANQVKAMALAQLGKLPEAQLALDAARQLHARFSNPLDATPFYINSWHDWYIADIMFREADALLLAKSSQQAVAAPEESTGLQETAP
jgi:tetratricopeptide (TPR) repeat protein